MKRPSSHIINHWKQKNGFLNPRKRFMIRINFFIHSFTAPSTVLVHKPLNGYIKRCTFINGEGKWTGNHPLSVSEEGWAASVPTFLFVLRVSRIRFDQNISREKSPRLSQRKLWLSNPYMANDCTATWVYIRTIRIISESFRDSVCTSSYSQLIVSRSSNVLDRHLNPFEYPRLSWESKWQHQIDMKQSNMSWFNRMLISVC